VRMLPFTPMHFSGCSLRISPLSHLFGYAKVAERSELHSIAMDVSFPRSEHSVRASHCLVEG
jgi:hypothetical protein